ncbi:HD domain-containing protein [Rhodococcus sp. NPDC003318]|uniref:HD domain-containing protein n=1 Tax=Rhodococcus sp. NPDC003318 TaxID=3364503 RepID=UPI00369B8C81
MTAGSTPAASSSIVTAAESLTHRLLDENRGRLHHCAGVAARARALTPTVAPDEGEILVAAAWLHDIGYSTRVRESGFHPLDGARYLRRHHWPALVCDLVAHHSGSRFVAVILDLTGALAEFTHREDALSDALTVADKTTGPDGAEIDLDARMRGMLSRHDPASPTARAHGEREPYFRAAFDRVEHRLKNAPRP